MMTPEWVDITGSQVGSAKYNSRIHKIYFKKTGYV